VLDVPEETYRKNYCNEVYEGTQSSMCMMILTVGMYNYSASFAEQLIARGITYLVKVANGNNDKAMQVLSRFRVHTNNRIVQRIGENTGVIISCLKQNGDEWKDTKFYALKILAAESKLLVPAMNILHSFNSDLLVELYHLQADLVVEIFKNIARHPFTTLKEGAEQCGYSIRQVTKKLEKFLANPNIYPPIKGYLSTIKKSCVKASKETNETKDTNDTKNTKDTKENFVNDTKEALITEITMEGKLKRKTKCQKRQEPTDTDNIGLIYCCMLPSCKEIEKERKQFKRCGRGCSAAYCSRECQRVHWKTHKNMCVASSR